MAGLSQHPNIVTVFSSGRAGDGRPYLALEYYPGQSLARNLQGHTRSVAEVVAMGVQLAGAVESAHRLGILHRDIKPANILVGHFGQPVLGDFGIATNTAEGRVGVGLSVPWSPPEALGTGRPAGPAADIWGLAATLYALLTGRSPFEVPGGNNSAHALADRIRTAPYRPLGRADAPASLDRLLGRALAKDPAGRPKTMLAFGQALQGVERELGLPQTRLEVIRLDRATRDAEVGESPASVLRPITTIDPEGDGGDGSEGTAGASAVPARPARALAEPAPAGRRGRIAALAGLALLLVAALAVLVVTRGGGPGPSPSAGATAPGADPQNPMAGEPLSPVNLRGELDAAGTTAHFEWTSLDFRSGDHYLYRLVPGATALTTTEAEVDVPVPAGAATVCLAVQLIHAGQASPETEACATPSTTVPTPSPQTPG
jgi:hypothetical protein